MKIWMILFNLVMHLLSTTDGYSDINVVSWNAKHLGRARQNLNLVAKLLGTPDLIAIQEVNLSKTGAKALADLKSLLGVSSEYCSALSEIPSDARERYAVLWKESTIAYVSANGTTLHSCPEQPITLRLGNRHAEKIVREPAVGVFIVKATRIKFHLATIHLVPSRKRPEQEVQPLFETVDTLEGNFPKIVLGDFNLASDDAAFFGARALGYSPAFDGDVKTSLRKNGAQRSRPYDNIWVKLATIIRSTVIDPVSKLPEVNPARFYDDISDHLPIEATVSLGGRKG